jgi:hypothetical protein
MSFKENQNHKQTQDENEKRKEIQFNRSKAFFIGPKGANLPDFRANVNTILDVLLETRLDYMPKDTVCE